MRVALTGPLDLQLLQPALTSVVTSRGYPFPMTAHLALRLVELNHRVHVVTLDPTAGRPYQLTGPSLDVSVLPMRPRARDRALDGFRVERRLLADALRSATPDIVHAHWTYEFALAAERSGLPTLVTVHDWAPAVLAQYRDMYRAIRLGMQVRALAAAKHVSAVSPYIQGKVRSRYRKSCSLIPNGIADAYFDVPSPERADGVRFGCLVTSDDRRKNLGPLLEAFGLVRARAGSPAHLTVAGGGCGPEDRLHRWARERGLHAGVEFRGRVEATEVPAYLAGLDVFVHPAREESFGMTLVEAMAAGVPVVGGRRSGAVPWLLENGRSGVLADVTHPGGLADAMRTLLDVREREAWGARARARAENFRMSAVADLYVEEYRRVLG
ncbi:MAG TPA: glycosyltransferase family 4 protein [Nocardioides sp.]|uniref:glycosyltransferase family 4 protein n=1 Tax=Nocardioides sp. TaxID=35761 RepID=UPI002F3F5F43